MTINLADNTPRVSYAVAEGATQTSFTVSFEFFDAADLNVYVDGVLKTLTTNYTVSGGNGTTGTVAISVTGATGGSTVVITRDIDLKRTTDFPASGAFQIGSLNTELDKLIAIAADLDDKASRALQLTDFDAAVSLVLPDVNTRKGKTLAFNASTGAVEAGPSTSDVQTVSATAADIAALADIEDGTIATDAISGLAAIKTNVSTVAGIASNVTTVAGNTSNINAVAADASDIGTVASNISSVNTNASNISAIQGAAANAATASTKATEAAASAATASTQASNASTSAATSTTQATNSSNSATAAASSATAAASSASSAASSQSAAASSATAAAASQTAAASSAAAAASSLDSFDDRYLGVKSSNPTQDNDGNALVSGALYFNDSANEMRVYDGANWIAATSAGNVSLILYEYNATANQTTFSGSDTNSATLSYTVDNLQVVMNGIVLDPSDFTATNGTSVVLASGAAAGDVVNIYAFKSFTTADMVSKTNGGTFAGNVTFADAKELRFGDDNDFSFKHNNTTGENLLNLTTTPLEMHQAGTNSVLQVHNDDSNHNQLVQFFKGNSAHGNISTDTGKLIIDANGELELRDGGSAKLNTTSSGVNVTGNVSADGLRLGDGDYAAFGEGQDLQIIHNGSNSFITDAGTGDMYIRGDNSLFIQKLDGSQNKAQFITGGAVNLMHNGTTRFSTTSIGIAADQMFGIGDGDTGIALGANGADIMQFYTGNSEHMRITSAGNIGIGGVSPLGSVHIRTSDASLNSVNANADDLILENNGNCGMSICSSTSGEGNINFIDSGDTNIGRIQYNHSTNQMDFRTNDTVRMCVRSGGEVNIGSASNTPSGANQQIRLTVRQDQGTDAVFIDRTSDIDSNYRDLVRFARNGTTVGQIKSRNNAVQYNTTSDARLKENVEDMTGAIDRVKTLKPKRYSWIVDDLDAPNIDGFLAHEAQAVVPDAVSGKQNEVDDDGNPIYQGIDHGLLVPLLTGALKEAIAKIETLETKVAALEAAE